MIIMMVEHVEPGGGDGGCGSDETGLLKTQASETSDPFKCTLLSVAQCHRAVLHYATCTTVHLDSRAFRTKMF